MQAGRYNTISIDDTAECTSIGSRDNAYGIPHASLHAVGEKLLSSRNVRRKRTQFTIQATVTRASAISPTLYRTFHEIISLIKVFQGVTGIKADV